MGNKKNRKTKIIREEIESKVKEDVATSFECDHCPFETTDVNELTKHEAACCSSEPPPVVAIDSIGLGGDSKFACPVCNQTFKYETGFKKHRQRHEPPGGFICSHCNECFLTDADRILHKDTAHKVFKCMICSAKFESEKLFFDHINELHDGKDREYSICLQCGSHFRLKSLLKLHIESKCGTERSYSCSICHSKFLNQYTLKTHIQIHVGKKKYLCGYCGASFLSRGQLHIHERSHTKERPFKCSICDKAFAYRESLVTHSSIHTGIKPYICECCSSQFSCVGNLIKHRKARTETCGLPKYTNKKCAPRASTKVLGSLASGQRGQSNRSTTSQSAYETEFLSVEVLDCYDLSSKEEMQTNHLSQQNDQDIESNHTKRQRKEGRGTSSGEEVVFFSENERFISSNENENDNNVATVDTNDNSHQPNHTIIVEEEGDDSFHLTADTHGNWQKSHARSPKSDDNLLSSDSTTNIRNMIIQEEFENDCTELLLGSSSGNSETASTHYLRVEPILDVVFTNNTTNISSPAQKRETKNNDEEIYECDLCQKQFNQKKSLAMHFAMVHRERKEFNCQYCPKTYSNQKLLEKHVTVHGDNGKLIHKCPCCKEYFATQEEMRQHARGEHEDRLKCAICNKFYKNLDSIDAHMRAIHRNSKSKKNSKEIQNQKMCMRCGRTYYSHRALTDHELSNCGQNPIYKCEHCENAYHSLGSLKTHQLIHSGDLPFSCSFCEKKFRTLGQIKVHERCHTKEKPYHCAVLKCGKSFGHRASLVTHMSLHTGLKRYMCQCCSTRFSCISNLKAHRRTHHETCGQVPLITKAQYGYSLAEMK